MASLFFPDYIDTKLNVPIKPTLVKKFKIVFVESSSSDEDSDDEDDKIIINEDDYSPPDSYFGIKLLKPYTLYPHQIDSLKWMKNLKNCRLNLKGGIVALSPGLGKSLIYASYCMSEKLHNDKPNYPNLTVCSKTVAYSWKLEIKKFFGDSCPYFFMHKEAVKNFNELTYDSLKKYKIIITTYETVMSVAKKHKIYENQFSVDDMNRKVGIKSSKKPTHTDCLNAKGGMILFKTPWNSICADESHRFANPTSSTFYSMMALYGDKKWNLSGTPLRNYSSDLYSQFRFNGYDKNIIAKQFNFSEYQRNKMSDFTLYKNYEQSGITLPPITRHNIEITLDDKEKEIYDYYFGNMRKVYNGFLVGNVGFSSVLTLFLRLRQLCVCPYTILNESSRKPKTEDEEYTLSQKILDDMTDGLSSWVKDKKGTSGILSSKMKAMVNILKNIKGGKKTLVFTSFKKVIDVCTETMNIFLPKKKYLILDGDVTGESRDNVITNFKDPDCDYEVLFISYKVGSEGLTLVEAENVIHMENWWTPVVQEQAERRIWRIGQNNPVNIYNITTINSIEQKIEEICDEKRKLIEDFKNGDENSCITVTKLDARTIGRLIKK